MEFVKGKMGGGDALGVLGDVLGRRVVIRVAPDVLSVRILCRRG